MYTYAYCLITLLLLAALNNATPLQTNLESPPHAEVAAHNQEIGAGLLARASAAGFEPVRNATLENPLRFFGLRLVALQPSAGTLVSAAQPPRVLWAWGADQASEFSEGELSGCGSSRTRLLLIGRQAEFKAEFSLHGTTRTVTLSDNVVTIPYTAVELEDAAPANLSVRLTGQLTLEYDQETTTVACSQECNGNSCTTQASTQTRNERKRFHYGVRTPARIYQVVGTRAEGLLLQPFARLATSYNPRLEYVLASNQPYARILTPRGNTSLARFAIEEDELGAWRVTFESNLLAAPGPVSVVVNESVNAKGRERNYTRVYRVRVTLVVTGLQEARLVFEDYFGFIRTASETLRLRVIASLETSREGNQTRVRLTGERGEPLASQPLYFTRGLETETVYTDARGEVFTVRVGGVLVRYPGSDAYAPTATYLAGEPEGVEPLVNARLQESAQRHRVELMPLLLAFALLR